MDEITTSHKGRSFNLVEGRDLFIFIILITAFISLTIKIIFAPVPIQTLYTEEENDTVDRYATFIEQESWANPVNALEEYSGRFEESLTADISCENKLYSYNSVLDLLSFQIKEFSTMSDLDGKDSCLTASGFPKHLSAKATFVASSVAGSVVKVKDGYSYGTGFFIENNLILTNYHVVSDSENRISDIIEVETYSGEMLKAIYLKGDAKADVALLQIENPQLGIKPLAIATKDLKIGEPVFTVGHPSGQKAWTTISGVYYTSEPNLYGVQSGIYSLPSFSGLSGSPILNLQGEVVGMVYGSREIVGSRGIDSRYQIPLHTSIVSDYTATKAVSIETLKEYYK